MRPKFYAQALFEATRDLKKSEIDRVVTNFIQVLVKQRALFLIDKIIFLLKKIWRKEEGIIDLEITTAQKISDFPSLISPKIEIKEKIDPTLIGGAIIKYDDVLIDGSLRKKMEILRNNLKAEKSV